MIFCTSALRRATITGGMPAGPNSPIQLLTSNPGTDSATVGTSGKAGERAVPSTASERSFAARTCGSTVGMVAKIIDVCPPSRSVIAGTLPL